VPVRSETQSARRLRQRSLHVDVRPPDCHVLVEDPALSGGLTGSRLVSAQRACVAAAISLERRRGEPVELTLAQPEIGLLVIEGKLIRHVYCTGLAAAEVIGPGDLIRPHHPDGNVPQLPVNSNWQVIEPTRLAVLDLDFAQRAAPFPEITCALTDRLIERSRAIVTHMAIVQTRRVSGRIVKLLWYLASRWGSITPSGASLRLQCTHSNLAELVAATRPSVTLALQQLESTGLVSRSNSTWTLREPPAHHVP
jgi:CRP/FNR family cyclic AMP-dependent transcriptional regulator